MTEPPPGAGSDPAMLRTRAEPDGDGWVIDGDKWYITGADGAAFAIVMARNGDHPDSRPAATMFLVDADNPGFRIARRIPSLDVGFPGGHCVVELRGCRVGPAAVLGAVGEGFRYAQVRLAPARLTHCMRWLGVAGRALDIALAYANERTSFGRRLGEHQMVGAMLADSAMELHAARLMTWHAAWIIDTGGQARQESAMAKTYVSEVVGRVVDRALQVRGSHGVSAEGPLPAFYRAVRPFRIYDGPSEVHRMAIAGRLLREAAGQD
jgi:acyl-CoA dehydrogenase